MLMPVPITHRVTIQSHAPLRSHRPLRLCGCLGAFPNAGASVHLPRTWSARSRATALGVLAIVLWSTSSAAAVSLVEQLGPWTSLTLVSGIAGIALALVEGVRHRQASAFLRIGWRFGLTCGACFVAYQFCYYWAFSQARDRNMAMQLNLINYLWPSLMVLVAQGRRAQPFMLGLALVIGFIGIAAAISPDLTLPKFIHEVAIAPLPFLAMFGAAVAWVMFSLLVPKLQQSHAPSGTAAFFLVTAVVAGCIRLFVDEPTHWEASVLPALFYTALIPSASAYLLWERSMHDGDASLLGSLGNALPLLSTLISGALLGLVPTIGLLIGACLVVTAAILARKAAR